MTDSSAQQSGSWPDQFRETIANRHQAGRHGKRRGIMNDPEIMRAKFVVAVGLNNGHPGVAERRINREHTHR